MSRIRLNAPPSWLSRALGFISSETPGEMDQLISPVVETVQGGQGVAFWEDFDFPGAVGSSTGPSTIFTTQRIRDPRFAYLMRCEFRNPGTAAADFVIRCLGPLGNGLRLAEFPALGAGLVESWAEVGRGAQFWYIPPNFDVTIQLGSFTTTAGGVFVHLCRIPAGVKGW